MDSKAALSPLPALFPVAGTAPPTPQDFARLSAELAESRETIARHEAALHAADLKIQALTLELAHHKRLRFGQKSEALVSFGQRDLFAETLAADQAAIEAELEQLTPKAQPKAPRKPRVRAGRQPLPPHLPRIEHRHEPESCQCGACGQGLVKIGEDITEQLDVEPARFFVHRHIRPQYACPHCETVTAAAVPPAVIDGGLAATGLLVWVLIGKFLDHLPLYRLSQIAARQGVPLALSTLAEWVGRLGVALQPLADRLAELQRLRPVLHADETPVRQLDPGGGKTKTAYLWAYRSNGLDGEPPILLFDYQTSRAGKHASAFLRGWQGHLLVDDYAGYKALFKDGTITEPGCMAHARRKFFDLAQANGSPIAARALRHIARLYRIEAKVQDQPPLVRQRWRARHALPRLRLYHAWLVKTRATIPDGTGIAKALDYTLHRWPALSRYAETGHLPIDNNAIENAIRPIAVGKKNWLFAGSERAGKRAAVIQSLLGTAKLNGLDPAAWLTDTLDKLPTWPNSRLDELLPLRRDQKSP
jgi:transposase